MNDHKQPAPKPGTSHIHLPNRNVTNTSPALQGATSAFLPKAPSTTTSVSSVSALPLSAGARHAARAVASQSLSPPHTLEPYKPYKEPSPERGRALQPDSAGYGFAARSAFSSQSVTSPPRPLLYERSPSAIAARYASSRSSSPVKSPDPSPHGRRKTLVTPRGDQHLTPDISRALAGAVASMAASRADTEHQPSVPVKSRVLNFESIPQLSVAKPHATPVDTGSIPLISRRTVVPTNVEAVSIDKPHAALRGRTQSVGATLPTLNSSPSSLLKSPTSPPAAADPKAITKAQDHSRHQRPPVPTRLSHKAHSPNLLSVTTEDKTHRGLTVNGLADAMVASSLASSRAASPVKRLAPPTSRRRSRSFPALYDISTMQDTQKFHKPLKPPRPMKHTLRKRSEDDGEEEEGIKRGRRHWVRKHPNKHNEGDRKRWRDKVTEPERKRYEGVFAANRGLLIGPGYFQPSPSALADNLVEGNKVANIIVRELWERSRLPSDVLMEIYDLVAPAEEKALNREQFVVGMWLIDQRLKGRKLPVKVSSSVWTSVRHPDGIKLRKNVM